MPVQGAASGSTEEIVEEEDLYTLRFGTFLQELEENAFRDAATFGENTHYTPKQLKFISKARSVRYPLQSQFTTARHCNSCCPPTQIAC